MTRITINLTSQTPNNKNHEGHRHYFTPMQIKVRDAVQFYDHMGIDYVKRDIF